MGQLNGVPVVGSAVATVGTATSTVASFDCGAPPFCGAIDNSGFYVEGVLVGVDATGSHVVSARVSRSFSRFSGTLAALGGAVANISPMAGDAALTGAVPLLNASGTVIRLQVTGVLAVTLSWTGYLYVWSSNFTG